MATASTIAVLGMHCPGCENAVRTTLCRLAGVHSVHPDAAAGTVKVSYDQGRLSEADIRTALAELGYEPVG